MAWGGLWFFLVIHLFGCTSSRPFSLTSRRAWAVLSNLNKKKFSVTRYVWKFADDICFCYVRGFIVFQIPMILHHKLSSIVVFLSMMSWCLHLWPQSWGDFTSTQAHCSSERPPTRRERGTRWGYLNAYITEHEEFHVIQFLLLKWKESVSVYMFSTTVRLIRLTHADCMAEDKRCIYNHH